MPKNPMEYRQQLLAEARATMSSSHGESAFRNPGLIHPRYGRTQEHQETEGKVSFFKVRCVIAVVLFLGFLVLYTTGASVFQYDSQRIVSTFSDTIEAEDVSAYIQDVKNQLFPEDS